MKEAQKMKASRMVNDVEISMKLAKLIKKYKSTFLLDCGYAVDLVVNKRFSRFHHDIDCKLLVPNFDYNWEEVILGLVKNISSLEWKTSPTKSNWVWLQAEDKNFQNLPRQFNIHLLQYVKVDYKNNMARLVSSNNKYTLYFQKDSFYQDGNLIGSFYVPTIEQLVADKLRLISFYAPDWKVRNQDIYDFKLLLNSGFSKEKCINILEDYFIKSKKLPRNKAFKKSTQLYEKLVNKIANP